MVLLLGIDGGREACVRPHVVLSGAPRLQLMMPLRLLRVRSN
jgi:hypothetical protein